MKRFLLFWIFILMVLAVFAQGQTSRNDANGQAQREPNTHVTVVQAREVGLKFLNANARTPLRCANELQLATTYQTSHGDEAFYVFNTQNGFVMVAADRCATPILGYSDEGAFDVNNVPIQMQSYLQGFVEQIAYGQEHNVTTDARVEQQWQQVRATGRLSDTRSNESVEPLITAKWDQGCYYNDKCPEDSNGYCGGHVPTGCAATAMGMIMHYWKYPIHGNGSISQCYAYYPTQNVDFAATTYDWNNMPDQLDSNSTQVQIDAVSTLLWHCGVAVRMAYSPLSSAAMNLAIEPAFKNYFMYSEDLYLATRNDDTEWLFKIKTELLHQRPIYYMGDTHQSGHAFVCDGFDENDFLHFNWGWSGYNNGYFALHEMTLEDNYGFFNQAIFNLRPSCDSTVVYHVSTNCVPSNGGVVSGGAGNYSCGQVCNLIAEPSQGYFFLNWMENGNVISTDPRYTFDVIGNKSLVANFIIPDTFTISATSNPQNAGVISGTGEYPFSATCVLSATPDTGYFFVNWTENGEVVSTESTYSFSVSNERNLTANFTLPFSITVTASPNSGGITTGMGYYDYGSMCTVSATPNSGYVFFRWIENGEVVSFDSDYSFEVIGNRDLVAEFVTSFVISASAASSSGGGVITGTGQYDYGQMCSLTAHPNEGCSFLRWTENGNVVSVDSNYSFVVTNNRNLVAHFTSDQTCEIVLEMNYWFYPDNYLVLDYGDGTSELFTVTEGIDSSFMRTVVNYSTVGLSWFSGTNPYSCKYNLSYGNGAPIIQCYFPFETSPYSFVVDCIEANSPCTVYVTTNAEDRGTASGGGLYQIGQNCIVNAIPQEGYEFLNWSENGEVVSYNSEYSFTVTKSRNLVACFDKLDSICTLIFDFSDGGLLSWMDGKVILEYDGISEELSAGIYHRRIINGSHIKMTWNVIDYISNSWSVSAYYENGSTALPPSPPPTDFYSSVIYEFDVDCEAAYSSYFVLAQADAPEKGSVSGMGEFGAGETCTLVAVSNPGYTFMYWTENGEIVSYQAEYSFHVYDNRNLVANFLMPLTIDVSVDNPDNGIVNGSGEYAYGTTCTLTAIPNSDYVFLKWTENGVTVSTASEYTFTVTEGRDLVAHFIEPDSVCDILFKLFWSEYDRFLVVTYEDGGYEKLTVNAGDAFNAVHKRTVPKRSYLSLSWESPGESFFGCSFYVYYENGLLIYQGSEADVNYVNGFLSDIEVDCEGAYVSRSINAIPNIPAGGVIQGEGTYETGEICILKAMPNEGYSFLYWTENDEIVSNESFYPFVVTDDRTLVAHFSLPYHVTVVPDKEEGGSVVGGGAYVYGQTCIVTASKSDNYTFLNWTENGRIVSADSVYSFRVSADCNLVAHFVNSDSICNLVFDLYSPFFDGWDDAQLFVNYGNDIYEEFTLTSTREGSFSRTVEEGSHISLSWFLDYPRSFEVHYDNGVPIFDSDDSEDWTWNNYEFDIDCAGAYSPRTIQVFVDSSDRGTANGEGTYESGQICTLMAVPNSGYIFDCWTINGEIVSYEPTYSFVVTEDGTFVANFIEECLGRYVVIDLYWHWSSSHELILEHNGISEQFTVDPICDSATFYRFLPGATHVSLSFVEGLVPWLSSFAVRYRDGGVIYQSSYPYENLPFEFDVDSLPMCPERIVSVTSNPEIGGFVTGGGSYNHGDTCTLIAVPNEGYCFVEWTNQGMEISNNDILIFPVFGNTEYVAHFVPNSFSFADTSCVSYIWNDIIYMETGDYEQTFIASNGCDSAVTLHLTINNPVYSAVADTACESYTWNNTEYTESGDYTYTHEDENGCLQVDTLHLTIGHSNTGDTTAFACESFTWYGETYTETPAVAPTHTFTNASGCDSVVTLHLTIGHSNTGDTTAFACNSFTWYGETYTETPEVAPTHIFTNASGCDSVVTLHLTVNNTTYGDTTVIACNSFDWYEYTGLTQSCENLTHTFTNATGCDSVVTLHLTIDNPVHAAVTETACESFAWNGTVYTVSGDYTYSHEDAYGCMQVDTLHLTINQGTHNVATEVACESYEWHNSTYSTSGTYTYEYFNENDCASVDTLHLTINHTTTGDTTATSCESFTWEGTTFTESGDYMAYKTNAAGCDSIVTLHLTVNPSFSIEAYLTISENDLPFTYGDTTFMPGTVQSGDYIFNFITADGCDSVIILHLTVETGINDYSLNASMKIYPNPTKDVVNVQLTMNNEQLDGVGIQVFDVYGRLLEVVNMADARGASLQTAQIDFSRYANGVYLVKAVAEGNVLAVRKVVKK